MNAAQGNGRRDRPAVARRDGPGDDGPEPAGTAPVGYVYGAHGIIYEPDTPMANLLLTKLNAINVPIAQLGNGTGPLPLGYSRA